ncbi:MAG: serine/threonine-protein kinase [Pirellulales bacterium]
MASEQESPLPRVSHSGAADAPFAPPAPDVNRPDAGSTHSQRAVGDETDTWRAADAAALPAAEALRPFFPATLPGYEVIKVLGRGGMGIVLQARDLRLHRLVALKMPLTERMTTGEERERFLREARAAAKLRHPGICPIYEISEADGRPYLALAFIDGEPLSSWAEKNRPAARTIAEIVAAVAEAVQAAHEHDVIHRDLKPSNVMMEQTTQTPILMDFGLAKDQSVASPELTCDGDVVGTPAYMAPEQAAGRSALIGPRSDVYGLGAILYSLLAGRPPFSGTFADVMRRVQDEPPTPPRALHVGLHRDLETICLKAMAKHPGDRYASAAELAGDLRRFARGEAILARPEGGLRKLRRFVVKRRTSLAAALAIAATLAVAGFVWQRASRERRIAWAIQRFDGQLEQGVDVRAQYEQLERLADELQLTAPAQAEQARSRLSTRFAESLRRVMQRPTLDADELAHLQAEISFLAARTPTAASELSRELDQRLRNWTPLLDLQPPFADLNRVFGEQPLVVVGQRLARPAAPTAAPAPDQALAANTVLSTISARGNLEWRAWFALDAVGRESPVGATFHFSPRERYDVVIAFAPETKAGVADSENFESALGAENESRSMPDSPARHGGRFELRLLRNGLPVRRQMVQRSGDAWELSIRREAGKLACRLGSAPALIYDDVFPLGQSNAGRLGLILPEGVGVVRLQASRQLMPTQPSPWERGDELMSQEQFQEAFDQYRLPAQDLTKEALQESRTKQGLCLIRLGRDDEAAALLEEVAAEQGERWPIVAAAHLWLLRLRQGRLDDAELIRSVLASRYDFEQLASLLPEELRYAVAKEYLKSVQGANLMTFNAERLAQLDRVAQAERLVKGRSAIISLILLMRGYRMLAQEDRALQLAAEIHETQRDAELSQLDRIWLAEEFSWLLRRQGRVDQARDFINVRLQPQPGRWNIDWLPLLVERARVEVADGNLVQAERDLATLFEQLPVGRMTYRHYSAARLLQGCLRDMQGDAGGAKEAWSAGGYRRWHPEYLKHWNAESHSNDAATLQRPALPAEHPHLFSGVEFVQFILLSSLAETLTEAEATKLFQWLTFRMGGTQDNTVLSVVSLLQGDIAYRTFRDVCRTPRGKQVAQDIALQRLGMDQFVRQPLYLMVYEVARQGAFPQGMSETQDQLIWRAAQTAHDAYLAGRVSKPQVLGMAFTWRGQTGAFGWDGISGGLEPTLRGPMAFVFAHRLRQLKRPTDAERFFREAAAHAGADALLKSEAEREAAVSE